MKKRLSFEKRRRYMPLAAILIISMVLLACGASATSTPQAAAPTATAAPAPTAVPAATATPAATKAPAATATAIPAPEPVTGFAKPGVGGVPTNVGKLTVASDGIGFGVNLNPVDGLGFTFVSDYFNNFMLTRDENHNIVAGLLVEWEFSDDGFGFTIHPDAIWHDGSPITSNDVKWIYDAARGDHKPEFTGHWAAARFQDQIEEVQVFDDKRGFVKTTKPTPDFVAWYTGAGYHQFWLSSADYLQKVGVDGYEEAPLGGGPYTVSLWKAGERIVLERWEDFWSDTDVYHKPQHETLEVIVSPDEAARFALIKSNQVDMVVNIPYATAREIPQSEDFAGRGINPEQGSDIWTQTIVGTGQYVLHFPNMFAGKDAQDKPGPGDHAPFDDVRVREALEIAIDKQAISDQIHYGFSFPMGGLFFIGGFAYRDLPIAPYDPERAKELMVEAGYADGFSTDIYFGPYVNIPGVREWLDAAASYWTEIDVNVQIFEIDAAEYWNKVTPPERAFRPVALFGWGRQEHAGAVANYSFHETGSFVCCWDDVTNALWEKTSSTTDEASLLGYFAEMEDYILEQRWLIPMAQVSVVQAYTDRVLAHPTPPHANTFEQLWRIVLRD